MFGEEEAGQPHSNKDAAVLIAYEAVGCGLLTDMVSYLGGCCTPPRWVQGGVGGWRTIAVHFWGGWVVSCLLQAGAGAVGTSEPVLAGVAACRCS